MPHDTPSRHHTLDYVELTVPDVAVAKAFYSAAFGWSFTDYGPEYAGIRVQGGAREVGGITKGQPTSGAGPLIVLYSSDLESTLGAVEAAGGRVVDPPFAFPGGRRFHFTDPGGNRLGVWTERPAQPA